MKFVERAEAFLRLALREEPEHARVHGELGFLLENFRQDIDGAERDFHKAIEINPMNACAHNNLAMVLLQHRRRGCSPHADGGRARCR